MFCRSRNWGSLIDHVTSLYSPLAAVLLATSQSLLISILFRLHRQLFIVCGSAIFYATKNLKGAVSVGCFTCGENLRSGEILCCHQTFRNSPTQRIMPIQEM